MGRELVSCKMLRIYADFGTLVYTLKISDGQKIWPNEIMSILSILRGR